MSLPDALVALRATLAFAIAALLAAPDGPAGIAAALFALGVATDIADGAIARRRGEASARGALLDTLADKLLVLGVLAPVSLRYPPAAAILAVLVARDLLVTWRRLELLREGLALPVTTLARLKTALLFAGCQAYLLALAVHSFGGIVLAQILVAVGAVAAVLSGLQYAFAARPRRVAR